MNIINNSPLHFESFTKEQAFELLNNAGQNRTLSVAVARSYRDEMNAGKWRENDRTQAPVIFDAEGVLRGGRHRMTGFSLSDLESITFPVIRDASESEILNQDGGYNRSMIHRIEMGFKVPEVGPLKAKMISASRILAQLTTESTVDPNEIAQVANGYAAAMLCIKELASKGGPATKFAPILAAFIWASQYMDTAMWEQAIVYFETGKNSPNPLLLRFREQVLQGKVDTRRSNELFFKMLSALKSTHTGKTSGMITSGKNNLEGWQKPENKSENNNGNAPEGSE